MFPVVRNDKYLVILYLLVTSLVAGGITVGILLLSSAKEAAPQADEGAPNPPGELDEVHQWLNEWWIDDGGGFIRPGMRPIPFKAWIERGKVIPDIEDKLLRILPGE